jgi:hypothetical protein
MPRSFWNRSRLALIGGLSALSGGCLMGMKAEEVVATPAIAGYESLVLIGLQGGDEELFQSMFMETFPQVRFQEKQAVLDIIPEADLLTGQSGNADRERVRNSLGVQGVVVMTMEDRGTIDWHLTITDMDTGRVTGSAVVRGRKEPLARGATFEELQRRAFEALISALAGREG